MAKTKLLLLLLPLLFTEVSAQDVWVDYLIGRPMQGFVAAKEKVAKKWGINYQVKLAGCVISDEINQQRITYQKQNKAYFEKIATKYGEDWQTYFNFECKVAQLKAQQPFEGTWVDPIAGRPNDQFLTHKKAVAESWGINYKAYLLGCTFEEATPQQKAEITQGNPYLQRLHSYLGDDWQKHLEREARKRQLAQSDGLPGEWEEYLLEKVDESFYKAKQAVLQKWGVRYTPYFVHCCKNKEKKIKKGGYAAKAAAFRQKIAAVYGADWEKYLNIEVQQYLVDQENKQK